MANIMSMVKLNNKTSRNAFDLSRRNAFTAKVGELLPVACIECIPGDRIKGRVQHFTRTVPVSTAAYTRIREYYDWFFVPTNLLWNKFNTFVTQMSKNSQHAISTQATTILSDKHPYFTANQLSDAIYRINRDAGNNMFGFKRAELSCKLLSYLGYGDYSLSIGNASVNNASNVNLNPFPLLAYQKIYQDYFRNSQWEDSFAPAFNVDYITNSPQISVSQVVAVSGQFETMFDLRYSNWNKDLFMGLLPNAQYGAASVIPVTPITGNDDSLSFALRGGVSQTTTGFTPIGLPQGANNTNRLALKTEASSNVGFTLSQDGARALLKNLGIDNISILSLRHAEALQKWREITQSQQQDYKNQIEAHFGVSMSDAYSERCKYIDGSVSNLDISEVMNNNITSDNPADIAGKGVGVGDSSFDFSSDVHGYLMCIYHATPLLDYSTNGIPRMNLKTTATDYAIPEFDATGMVSVPFVELTNSLNFSAYSNTLLGYAPRYYDYKQAIDEVHGAFKTSYSPWVAPISDDYIANYMSNLPNNTSGFNYRFFKVNPNVLNPIFSLVADGSEETDQLLVNASFGITAVRNLDRNGLPY